MFENIINFFKSIGKSGKENSKETAKERLHLVLAQDRANISADFLEMMKQEIIEVIKKYIEVDEESIDVRLTNKAGEDGTIGAPSLYANIPIVTIKDDARKLQGHNGEEDKKQNKEKLSNNQEEGKEEDKNQIEQKPVKKIDENKQDEEQQEEEKGEQPKEEIKEEKKENKEDIVSNENNNSDEVKNEETNS